MLSDGHAAALMDIERLLSAVCAPPPVGKKQLSVARTVKVDIPVEDGVPVINPVELIFSPAGSDPPTILKEIGNCPPELVT